MPANIQGETDHGIVESKTASGVRQVCGAGTASRTRDRRCHSLSRSGAAERQPESRKGFNSLFPTLLHPGRVTLPMHPHIPTVSGQVGNGVQFSYLFTTVDTAVELILRWWMAIQPPDYTHFEGGCLRLFLRCPSFILRDCGSLVI